MAETKMNVQLIAHTQLSEEFNTMEGNYGLHGLTDEFGASDGQLVALTAIRTCYSANKPTEIVAKEGAKYFGSKASDGGAGTDADRLFRHIFASKHTSTLEHISFTFAIEGVSRALLAQLTRHRAGFSFSVQSQRYVRMGRDDRSGGFDYVMPPTVTEDKKVDHSPSLDFTHYISAVDHFGDAMEMIQDVYDELRSLGVPAEDARAVLPNAAATNLVMTANLTALLSFYSKRKKGRGAQAEITELAEALRREVVDVEPWTDQFFEEV